MSFRKYITAIGVFITAFCSGQSYSFNDGTTYSVTLDTSKLFYSKGIELTNTGTVNLTLTWELTYKDTLIDSRFELCNSGECFNNLPFTGTMPVITPGAVGFLKMHMFSGKTLGRNVIKYVLKNGTSQIDTLTYIVYVTLASAVPETMNRVGDVSVFPNPASEFIIINGIKPGNTEIQLWNENGEKVLTKALKEQKNHIATNMLPSGAYFYKLTENNITVKSGKLLINSK